MLNTSRDERERFGRLLRMHANQREDVDEVFAGDIVAAVGLKNTFTGDTLSDPSKPLMLESIKFPEPVISVAIEPKSKADSDKMGEALAKLSEEDPTFIRRFDEETAQTIISGMGELHLEVIVDRMLREFGVNANVGRPQVAYREALTRAVKRRGALRAPDRWPRPVRCGRAGGRAARARRRLPVREQDRRRLGAEGIRRPDRGTACKEALESGPVGGYPVMDVHVQLVDGSTHPVDSSEMAFRMAGIEGMRKAMAHADAVMLEPVMKVEVRTPDQFFGDVLGDINSRRGQVQDVETFGTLQIIRGAAAAGRDVWLHDGAAFNDAGPRQPHDGV